MEKHEQDFMDKLKNDARDVKVPEQLAPEKLKETLKHQKRPIRFRRRIALLAAGLAVIIAAGIGTALLRQQNGTMDQTGTKQLSKLTPDDYQEVYQYVRNGTESSRSSLTGRSASSQSADQDMVSESSADQAESIADTGDYSETNTRHAGVDEGDIVKTDGRYLYVLKENRERISIVDTKDGLQPIGELVPDGFSQIQEIYLSGGQLIVIGSDNSQGIKPLSLARGSEAQSADDVMTYAVTYNIADPHRPAEEGTVKQSGYFKSSRIAGGCLYLFSDFYISGAVSRDDISTYVPKINDSAVKTDEILLPDVNRGSMYVVVSGISLTQPDKVISGKAVLTDYEQLYVSESSIYFYKESWDNDDRADTVIRRLSYQDGKIEAEAKGSFKGYLNDTFSIDEDNGYLRVVTTSGETNALYVLDSDLKVVGEIEGLAKEEQVYSARFMGDTGYFVTFKNVDPLFSVDLSDPENPRLLGALKIPGFSEYLHSFGEGKLLGIGMDADEDTGTTGGLKLSMFDISDPQNVSEADQQIIENAYYSSLFSDYKAVLIDREKNLIGFSAEGEGGEMYYLYSYDQDRGFTQRMRREVSGGGYSGTRGVFIGDTLYVINGNVIEAYSLTDGTKKEDLIL